MWWAFRRHRLAMIGLAVTLVLYMIAAVPGFFATNDPYQQNGRAAYHPPQAIHFIDTDAAGGWTFRPYFHPMRLTRDPVSLAAVYEPDTEPQDLPIVVLRRGLRIFGSSACSHRSGICSPPSEPREPLFLVGADRLGRCVWSRIMQGAQISLSLGLVGVVLRC